MFTIFKQCVLNLGNGWLYLATGTISNLSFQHYIYIFLARFTSFKIDGAVVCLSFAVNMARFGNISTDEFKSVFLFFYVQNEMLCTKQYYWLLPREQFSQCCLVRYSALPICYNSPQNTIGNSSFMRRQ